MTGRACSIRTVWPLANIAAMGADPLHKDAFFNIGYLYTDKITTYGGVAKPPHSHLPALESVNIFGDALKNAPLTNPDETTGIRAHFDVGNNYQTDPPNPYIIPAALAKGGKNLSETRGCPNPADPINGFPVECTLPDGSQGPMPGQYPAHPGTVGYATGMRFVWELLGLEPNRKDTFRNILFAHHLGIPVESCQLPDGPDADTEPDGNDENCQLNNPLFRVPRTNSGIAEFPGKFMMMTMGAFDDEEGKPVGEKFAVGSTMLHEWGHTRQFDARRSAAGSAGRELQVVLPQLDELPVPVAGIARSPRSS